MSEVLTVSDVVRTHARTRAAKIGVSDSRRSLSFGEWNERASRLASGLLGLGLSKGERVALLAYNCVEWMELYVALGRAGLVAVPINYRLVATEIRYIAEHCQARAFVVQHDLVGSVVPIRDLLDLPDERFIHLGDGAPPEGWSSYEALIDRAPVGDTDVEVGAEDIWALMYTSGTTGSPKGVIRSHGAAALLSLVTALDMGFTPDDTALLVLPMCHANSLYFSFAFAYLGATCIIDDHKDFDPEGVLATLSAQRVTFTSLVPAYYIMILGLSEETKRKYDVSRVEKLLISSAPARRDTKLAIGEYFTHSELYELYGSTEAGWVTLLRPDEQHTKLGSIGREWTGSGAIKLLDTDGAEVPDGEVGELFSRTPYAFDGYWNDPERTAQAFRGAWCTVGDLARRDEEGYYYLVDRKHNMIIRGGSNISPAEVENLLGGHPAVKDVAVIGIPDDQWGEAVHAVIVREAGSVTTEEELLEWCDGRIASYKQPRSIAFIEEVDMPRTASGKVLHRALRERWSTSPD